MLKPDMNDPGESDRPVLPTKLPNKPMRTGAEAVEGRSLANGNAQQEAAARTQRRKPPSTGLPGVRRAAEGNKDAQLTALLHHVTPEALRASFFALKRRASPGVDGVTWKEYSHGLEGHLSDLHDRVHKGTYRAQPCRRLWIDKADGRKRPLGIPALEDKVVQHAVGRVLEQIYEVDFVGFSYGFRPGRDSHRALDAVSVGIVHRKVGWVLDADIRGFFDAINHEWLIKFLEHRIGDRRIIRLVKKWLRAGVSEDGEWSKTTVGTPQGAVISPLLANVYLHYVLDLWVEAWRRKEARGEVIVVRYADDFVMGFQHESDANRLLAALRARFERFGLSLHPEKTRLIEFGRYAAERRRKRGQGQPETFEFLGFTHYCGTSRDGSRFSLKRKSSAKRMRAKLKDIKSDLWRRMHLPIREQAKWLGQVLRGWLNYHAVPQNIRRLQAFRQCLVKIWMRTLRRRSQKARRLTWARFSSLVERWLPRARILHPYPDQRLVVRPKAGAV